MSSAGASIAAAVATYNRRDVLRQCLAAICQQTRPPEEIIVVDNASTDGTADVVAHEFPEVRVVRMSENTGAAGGFAAGIAEGVRRGHDWVWVFNDDDLPVPDALATLLRGARRAPGPTGMVACARRKADQTMHPLGARWTHRHRSLPPVAQLSSLVPLDVVTFSGTLVSASLVRDVGLPRSDFFMMIEDLEYCLRARDAGWRTYAVPETLTMSMTMGSQDSSPPWRGYYQTRNQLLMSLSRRSPAEVAWWAERTLRLCAGALLSGDRPAERIRLRVRGATDALRGVGGRTIKPPRKAAETVPVAAALPPSTRVPVPDPGLRIQGQGPPADVEGPSPAVGPRILGVLVTFRRPDALGQTLAALSRQTAPLDRLVVIDNSPDREAEPVVYDGAATSPTPTRYLATGVNLGPAGGLCLGTAELLKDADDADWVVFLDDDNPPPDEAALVRLRNFATRCLAEYPETAAVGLVGARFDSRRARLVRPRDEQLRGAVPVDYVGGNQLPLYRVGGLRAVGPPRQDLFFGFDDLDLGLRLRTAGFSLWADGDGWLALRRRYGRLGGSTQAPVNASRASWRQYYSLRNLIVLARWYGVGGSAARLTLRSGLLRTVAMALREPRGAPVTYSIHARACRDAWTMRLGRRVEPSGYGPDGATPALSANQLP
jgi:rhamnopyranosyl-N-acetylglucosaminyl-diphospho-decaprenol beta-1,3/1,4-galactofuranosyltransferase